MLEHRRNRRPLRLRLKRRQPARRPAVDLMRTRRLEQARYGAGSGGRGVPPPAARPSPDDAREAILRNAGFVRDEALGLAGRQNGSFNRSRTEPPGREKNYLAPEV